MRYNFSVVCSLWQIYAFYIFAMLNWRELREEQDEFNSLESRTRIHSFNMQTQTPTPRPFCSRRRNTSVGPLRVGARLLVVITGRKILPVSRRSFPRLQLRVSRECTCDFFPLSLGARRVRHEEVRWTSAPRSASRFTGKMHDFSLSMDTPARITSWSKIRTLQDDYFISQCSITIV